MIAFYAGCWSQHLGTVGGKLEGGPQHICGTAAHQHTVEENLKVFIHRADICVDLQIEGNDILFGVNFELLVGDGVVDPVMNIKAGFGLFPHATAAHIGLVTNDDGSRNRVYCPAGGFIVMGNGCHNRKTVGNAQVIVFQNFVGQ